MTKHDYKQNAYYMIYLIKCILHKKRPVKEKVENINLEQLYQVAQDHSLTAICAYALESAGVYDAAFEESKNKAIRKNILLDLERDRIFAEFEKNKIWYCPLKGIIIKELYPQIGMRQMSDNDILCDSKMMSSVKTIMEKLDFKTVAFEKMYQDVYQKEPVYNYEMHSRLFEKRHGEKIYQYYKNIKTKLIKDYDNNYGYHFKVEDFYIFTIAHEYKHFRGSGTGIRSLLDTYVILKNSSNNINWEYIETELKKLGIHDFEKKNRFLSVKLFNGNEINSKERELLDYYIFSGTYGTLYNRVNNSINGNRISKLKYVCNRLFLSKQQINDFYPYFYKHKILLPGLFIYRLGLMVTKSRKRVINEIKALVRA